MTYTRKAKLSRQLSITLLWCLILYFSVMHTIDGEDVLFRWLVSCVPLLILIPGLIQSKHRAGSWLCFVLLLYFTVYCVELGIPGNQIAESLAMTLIVTLFATAMLYARWQQRADYYERSLTDGE